MMRNRIKENIAARSSISSSAIVDHLYVLLLREGRYMIRKSLEGLFPRQKIKSISLFLKNLPLKNTNKQTVNIIYDR